jgi:hypothetical protein
MGYWKEKKQYEREARDQEFCGVCGRKLKEKNVKGKCFECENIICNLCGKIHNGKVVCSDCLERRKKKMQGDSRKLNVFSILGFVLSFMSFLSIVGLIFCIIALKQTKDNKQRGKGLAIAGIIISILVFLFSFLSLL